MPVSVCALNLLGHNFLVGRQLPGRPPTSWPAANFLAGATHFVIPAKAGIHFAFRRVDQIKMDSGFRRNDGRGR
jgi:hypothetical protein